MAAPILILAGGGTGGHLYPGLAVAEAVRRFQADFQIVVFGTQRPIDRDVVGRRGFELVVQPIQPFPSRFWRWPSFVMAWRKSLKAARQFFQSRPPSVVLGLGGYAAAPAVVTARRLGIPTALFNPDAEPGRANRRLARSVDDIFVQWPATARHFDGLAATVHVTGCPVRRAIVAALASAGHAKFKLDPNKRTLLITGASQGARNINLACVDLIGLWEVAKDWQLIHVTGKADYETVRDAYAKANVDARVMAFTEDMPLALAAADLALSRAGASTLAELTTRGVASVLMPYPYDRTQHQKANARVVEEVGGAVVVEDLRDPKANANTLRPALRDLMLSDERRRRMAMAAKTLGRDDAAERIAQHLIAAAQRR